MNEPTNRYYGLILPTPIGELELIANAQGLCSALFISAEKRSSKLSYQPEPHAIIQQAAVQFTQYFAGTRQHFSLPLSPEGTAFQQQVWQALQAVTYGSTASYGDIAKAIAKPSAARAVGAANGKNPLSIVVPCHRIIASSGQLTGYAGGLDRKAGKVFRYLPKVGNFVLLTHHLKELRGFYIVFTYSQLGFQLVINQRVRRAIVVPGNVIDIAPVHIQHPDSIQPAWGDPVHINRRPSSG